MTCERRLWGEPDGLPCIATGSHRTHQYVASSGSHLGEGDGHHEPEGDEQ